MIDKEKIKRRNNQIEESIHISQARESNKGFQIFENHIARLLDEYEFPNIFSLQQDEDRIKAQARAETCHQLLNYLDAADAWALKPKVDEITGEEEKLRG